MHYHTLKYITFGVAKEPLYKVFNAQTVILCHNFNGDFLIVNPYLGYGIIASIGHSNML